MDEKRQQLAARLDEELDRFIDELAAKKKAAGSDGTPKKPFNFDEWCQSIDQHPAFMRDLKEMDGGGYSDAVEALRAIIYDEEEDQQDGDAIIAKEKRAQAVESLRAAKKRVEKRRAREAKTEEAMAAADLRKRRRLAEEFKKRNLHFRPPIAVGGNSGGDGDDEPFEWEDILVQLPQLPTTPVVYLDSSHCLVWPLLLQYPEMGQTDFLTDCSEITPIGQLLEPLFAEPAEWDVEGKFHLANIRVFVAMDLFEQERLRGVELPDDTLKKVLSQDNVTIQRGLPTLQIYSKSYAARKLEKDEEHEGWWKFRGGGK